MSLKFGLYLVEQGILSCDQFCGLVKIQQLAVPTPGSIALRKNLLTVKQVAHLHDLLELNPHQSFGELARQLDYLDAEDLEALEAAQLTAQPSIRRLVVECGLMTDRQAETLWRAFDKSILSKSAPPAAVAEPRPVAPEASHRHETVRQPKFKQRPLVARAFEVTY